MKIRVVGQQNGRCLCLWGLFIFMEAKKRWKREVQQEREVNNETRENCTYRLFFVGGYLLGGGCSSISSCSTVVKTSRHSSSLYLLQLRWLLMMMVMLLVVLSTIVMMVLVSGNIYRSCRRSGRICHRSFWFGC